MTEPITFGALVGLMVCGPGGPDTVRGVVRAVEDGVERRTRLARRGALVREEDGDGALRRIVGVDATWFGRGAEPPLRRAHETGRRFATAGAPIGGLDVGGPRPSWSRWDGTDFTRPTGPVQATEFLGRPAYALELAPPAHKPAPMQLVVDAATGLLLRAGNDAFDWVEEWTELDTGADLPDELFRWDGPAVDAPTLADQEAEHDRELAERRAWLAARGLAAVPLPVEPELQLHEWDEDGAFVASLHVGGSGALARRPRSGAAWPEAERLQYPQVHRWSDSTWDWCVALDADISPEQLALLRVRLATTT
jgi:hypothetical protein